MTLSDGFLPSRAVVVGAQIPCGVVLARCLDETRMMTSPAPSSLVDHLPT